MKSKKNVGWSVWQPWEAPASFSCWRLPRLRGGGCAFSDMFFTFFYIHFYIFIPLVIDAKTLRGGCEFSDIFRSCFQIDQFDIRTHFKKCNVSSVFNSVCQCLDLPPSSTPTTTTTHVNSSSWLFCMVMISNCLIVMQKHQQIQRWLYFNVSWAMILERFPPTAESWPQPQPIQETNQILVITDNLCYICFRDSQDIYQLNLRIFESHHMIAMYSFNQFQISGKIMVNKVY